MHTPLSPLPGLGDHPAASPAPGDSPVTWDPHGQPFSPVFGDRYRSAGTDGLGGWAQARYVFLAGCGLCSPEGKPLPGALWAGQPRWRVLENGLGLGLNLLATWHLWLSDPARPAHLIYDATEAHLPHAPDLLRAAAPFEPLHPLARELAAQWPVLRAHGHARLADGAISLHWWPGDAAQALARMEPGADSIFLDGFAPRLNPGMWSPAVLREVARIARPGTRAATWCVARSVREGLAQVGFAVERRPGLPPKRHALLAIRQS